MFRPLSRPRRGAALVAAAATVLALAACGAGEQSSSGSAGSTAGATSTAGVAEAKTYIDSLSGPPTWPTFDKLSSTPDVRGKTFTYVAFGDQVPVIHGIGVGVQQAFEKVGATVNFCDGKFNPSAVAACLKQAGDENVDGVITSFIDYQMAAPAFEALVKKGIKVLLAGVAPSGGRTPDGDLAFYNNTGRVFKLHEAMSESALADQGTKTNVLWVRLMDSTTTQEASARGIAKFKELCPTCGIATTEFTSANLDKLGSAISAALVANPDTNALIVPVDTYVPPAIQGIQGAGFAGKIKVFSSSSDVAGLERVKAGTQASDLGTPVLYEGWRFAHAMMQLLVGDPITPGDEFITRNFTETNIGDVTIASSAYLTDEWWGGSQYQQNFLTAWGLG